MPLEEPDTATAGTGPDDPDGARARQQRIAMVFGTALLVVLTVAAALVVTLGPDRSVGEGDTAARDAERPATEVRGTSLAAGTTTTSTLAGVPRTPSAAAPDATAPAGEPTNPLPPAPAPAEAGPPGVPVVSVGLLGPDGCAASWTVADGGGAIIEFWVTHESAPAPPGPDGTEIGTAMFVDRTGASTATVSPGSTIRVSARNAVGSGPTSAAILCG